MAALYHSLFTEKGLELLRESIQNGTKLGITHMSFGDGNGSLPTPDAKFTRMVNEVYRTALNRLSPSKENANWLEADGVIPSAVGGFNIREVGLWAGNVMVAYANYPPTYKPSGDQGTAQIKTIRIVLQIDNTANFELKIDASVVMATIQSVQEAKQDAIAYADETKTHTVNTVGDLANITETWDGRTVYVKGYHEPENLALAQPFKGGGTRIYNDSRKNENDGFLCINGWVLQLDNNVVTPEQAGAKGDGITDDFIALKKVFTSRLKVECDCFATYKTSKPIELFTGQKINGNGATISKYSASKTGITGRTDPAGNPYNYDQDCAVVFAAWYGYYSYVDIENLTIVKEKVNGEDVGKVFFAPYMSQSNFKSLTVKGGEYGFYCEDIWMMNWTRCSAYAKCGFYIGTGTSNTFDTCWSKETKAAYSAYRIHNLVYSTLKNCCAEFVGEDGKPAEAAFHISNSDLTMIGCGIEACHAYNLLRISYSWIRIESPSFIYGINNKYRHNIFTGLIDVASSDSVVTLAGGRILATNTGAYADAVRVDGGTFNYESPLWVGVGFPDDTADFKIRVSNWAAILNLSDFTGRKYTYSGRSKDWTNKLPTSFDNGIIINGLVLENLNDIRRNTTFSMQGNANYGTKTNNYPVDGFGGAILTIGSNDAGAYTNAIQLAFPVNSRIPYFRNAEWGGAYKAWNFFYTSANTTVTADGTLKAASPIVKLYSDHIECNDEAEEQNPLFEKVSTGHYLVKNTLGFAQDGWWIEVPSDSNGNKICAIKYKELENGDIEIKTFKRKFDFETASIVADEDQPIDIPKNMNDEQRWIDIRLHQLKKEITDQVNL
ncbi:phage tail protein [Acinetobacter nosocomialis]|uniref:phage tail protein n=1 Tax=Acinetobacter nosocomialis TaxID=106654 RepID=UPI00254FB467|nr:phage tail protein [Acinetobacter nosocomialis]MEC6035785.1 phage tail protein [Acinetobacter nosocomialis]